MRADLALAGKGLCKAPQAPQAPARPATRKIRQSNSARGSQRFAKGLRGFRAAAGAFRTRKRAREEVSGGSGGAAWPVADCLTLARCAALAYTPEALAPDCLPGHVVTAWQVAETALDLALVLDLDADTRVVAFRGTRGKPAWRNNRNYDWTPASYGEPGRLHHGFASSYADLHLNVIWSFAHLPTPYRPRLLVAGHSRGAAFAKLFSARSIQKPDLVATFGGPRFCDAAWRSAYIDRDLHGRTLSFTNNNDLVSHLPPWWLGWRHVGRWMYVDRLGRIVADASRPRIVDGLLGRLRHLGKRGLDAIEDHNVAMYVAALEAAAGMPGEQKHAEDAKAPEAGAALEAAKACRPPTGAADAAAAGEAR